MKEILRLKYSIVLIVILVFTVVMFQISPLESRDVTSLVIFGDNIQTDFKPFIENGGIYISSDTIGKTIDNNIFYDSLASKIIVTTNTDTAKFKVGEKKVNLNLEYKDIENEVKLVDEKIYIPINIFKDLYNIDVQYNEKLNSIVIDKKNSTQGNILYNKINVYSDIQTNSDVLSNLNKDDEITVYADSLTHNRWVKIKTSQNVVGYIFKNSLTFEELEVQNEVKQKKDKVVMFWQYGNSLNTLENSKIDVVNVVSPTLYELKNSKGDITSKSVNEYVNKAKSLGYKVWPIITNSIDSANYSPTDTSLLMNSESSRENLIRNILEILKNDNLDGINIDFENMKIDDRDLYTQFIRELAPLVRKQGKVISVDMYFVAYIDRKGVGESADYTILMGYDQKGGWSNESGSISEISWVEDNIKSLINDSKIPSDKIILGVPFYTRLWTEKTGISKPTTSVYTIKEAANYIKTNNLKSIFDEKSGQNFIEYTKGDMTYKMWIEDSLSMKNRVNIINTYELGGLAGWRKGFETPDIWKTISDNIIK
ncbi:MAG: glycosyl hydrolase family 18 protein [Clostridia bacterium]|nr:glycosyl hydrolase family 18 protein [Clostridia bacterium]MDD4386677.1 glycosyl hydrolase family 18 protein [Clostridia bacterium]